MEKYLEKASATEVLIMLKYINLLSDEEGKRNKTKVSQYRAKLKGLTVYTVLVESWALCLQGNRVIVLRSEKVYQINVSCFRGNFVYHWGLPAYQWNKIYIFNVREK